MGSIYRKYPEKKQSGIHSNLRKIQTMPNTSTITYKGKEVELLTEIVEMDEDVTKLGHYIVCKKTKEKLHSIDWSPYNEMKLEDLRLYISLDCPDRISFAPLDREDLNMIKKKKDLLKSIHKKTSKNTLEIS
jgi:hypothetical protein